MAIFKPTMKKLINVNTLSQAEKFTDKPWTSSRSKDGGLGISVGQVTTPYYSGIVTQRRFTSARWANRKPRCTNQKILFYKHWMDQHQTTLMITHRIEDLKQCDQIFVMQRGEIVQQGKFYRITTSRLCWTTRSTTTGYPIMRTLLPFIRLFKFAKFPLILGLCWWF